MKNNLRKRLLCGLFFCVFTLVVNAQKVAYKSNLLYLGTTTLNAEWEIGLSPKTTMSVLGAYNPWTFRDDKMMHLWAVQPEYKYWFCERFEGHFVGVHAHGAQFFGDFWGLNKDHRYDGYLVGAGASWGYDWILSPHWNLELELGFGVNRVWYKESDRLPCVKCTEKKTKTFFSPTKVALSLVYGL